MKICNLLIILSFSVLISGCTFITDPVCISLKDVEAARDGSIKMSSSLPIDKVRNNIKATASVKPWMIYRDVPSENCFVVMNVPGFIDTTEVGIYVIPQEEGGCSIEVGSLNPKAQKVIAGELFTILQLL